MPPISLPYHSDSSIIFNAIRTLPYCCWLDSGKPNSRSGRYDIMTARPRQRWISKAGITTIDENLSNEEQASAPKILSTEAPLTLINKASKTLTIKYAANNDHTTHNLPFAGGILAYFSYALGREQIGIEQGSPSHCQLPDMVAGLYEWAIIQDHQLKVCYLSFLPDCAKTTLAEIQALVESISTQEPAKAFKMGVLHSNTSAQEYYGKIAQINDYIHAGDCYQVNFSQCFSANYQGDPYTAYLNLRHKMASPFSAFMDIGENQAVMSLSPERLLQTQGNKVLTQPIKGTVARNNNHDIDQNNALALQASDKNRAENLMIVDLLRNDLGKNCIPGSIQVPALFALESYPNVHHLVSSVTGVIAEGKTALDVFQGCFPGGSITGAPKKRAMEIIEELENCQRSIYCGSIAYINVNGDMDSNITIRTIACDGQKLYCWGGGGIVADSKADEEYQESLTKIGAILRILEEFQ
jgi:para-aminobenzoate synthetase component I